MPLDGLRQYQVEGAAFLAASAHALLADEMGLGKTVQAAAGLALLRERRELRRALVVAPAGLRLNWLNELERWGPRVARRGLVGSAAARRALYDLPIPILVGSYEQVRADFLLNPPLTRFDVLVLDEAQRLKDPTSQATLATARVDARRIWALSGTPLENRVDDLVSVIRLMRPGALERSPDRAAVHEVLQGMFLRRRKQQVLPELPPIISQELFPGLTSHQRARYEEVWNGRDGVAPLSTANLLALITRLKQICNYDVGSDSSAKLDLLLDIAASVSSEEGKLLVFSQFVETLEWLGERLPLPSLFFHGGLSMAQREEVLNKFTHGEPPLALLVSLRAGGVGINIPAATHVVMFDRWWNPAVEDQAINRAHRFGRQGPLLVYRFITPDTVEERIHTILETKRQLFAEFVDDAPSTWEQMFSRGELLRILNLTGNDGGDHG